MDRSELPEPSAAPRVGVSRPRADRPRAHGRVPVDVWLPALYLTFSAAWIAVSDQLVGAAARSQAQATAWSTWKGFAFITLTALLLHALLRGARRRERQAYERLAASEARFRALIEKASDSTLLLDRDGRVRFWSPGAREALGWTQADVDGRRLLALVHRADRREVSGAFARLLRDPGGGVRVSFRLFHRDGEWRLVEAIGRNLLRDPAVGAVVVNARDVTEQRRLEERYRQVQKLESVARLAGGVAHDFNNLLTVILSCAGGLRADLEAERAPDPEDLEQIEAAGKRARDLTRQLLTFARKQVIAPVPLDLARVVGDAEPLLRRVLSEDVELAIAVEPGLWTALSDAAQVEQVLVNLVVNARDAMPRGGKVTIALQNRRDLARPGDAAAAEWVRLTVRDTGAGLSPEARAHLFEPFFTTKEPGRGTGLGLATVHGIVSQSRGRIQVESEPGRGTAVEIDLPRTRLAPEPARAAEADPAEPPVARRGSETILVVEDDPQVRGVTVRSLEVAGYRVLAAGDGDQALALARAEAGLDLVLADVVLPGLSGPAVVEALRRERPRLAALYVSGHTQEALARRGVAEGGAPLLPKPFTTPALLAEVRAALEAR